MVAERQRSELAEGGAEPPCREGGKELSLGTAWGAGLHSSEVPMGDWLRLFPLDFLSPFSEPSRWLSAAHTAWLARWFLSLGFQPLPCPSPQAAPRRGGCWLPFSTLWTRSGHRAPRCFSSRALAIISAKRVLMGRRTGLGRLVSEDQQHRVASPHWVTGPSHSAVRAGANALTVRGSHSTHFY